eukprot:CAMPEP_0171231196 /NCGR_PEP_ID=MMETSP0790-20130122/39780_1 /TAXON_ID=2925 /ORGANISM="Alexandrium catenella, Strain OF101" /LENGTH=74 /DNA_ID=CAMNT_0011697417 /DNA_START=184 /DNA_END=404 /DNA_ORIENTATION=+
MSWPCTVSACPRCNQTNAQAHACTCANGTWKFELEPCIALMASPAGRGHPLHTASPRGSQMPEGTPPRGTSRRS